MKLGTLPRPRPDLPGPRPRPDLPGIRTLPVPDSHPGYRRDRDRAERAFKKRGLFLYKAGIMSMPG